MRRRTVKLSDKERVALEDHRDHDPRPDIRERCAAVLKVAAGQSAHDVAAHGLLRPRHPDTVYGWLDRYEAGGLEGLMSGRQGGNRHAPLEEREAVLERLRQGPGEEARREASPTRGGPPPSRWTLRTIRATFPQVKDYTLSGVSRWLQRRVGVRLRSGRVQKFSPDPKYRQKVSRLKRCLKQAARSPHTELVFLDEMGYTRWPDPAADWTEPAPSEPPRAERKGSNNRLWRIVGSMNARTGRVTYLDNYIVGRAKLIEMYGRLEKACPRAEKLYVAQDNWSIHTHEDVLEALGNYPRIQPIWLPTCAPWLNPIEKLWRWLKESTLKMHRLADDWHALRDRVNSFLDQFSRGSRTLLRYTGLLGDGQLARAMHPD